MASITIAPRLEDPTSDIESVVTGGTVQIRISAPVSTGGQWLLPIWSPVIPIDGAPVVVLLDPNATVPYEARFRLPSGEGVGDYLQFTEFRKVVDATPRAWDTLEQVGGPSSPAAIPSDIASRLTALEATVASISGGASTLATITDMSPFARTLNDDTSATAALTTLGAAPIASPALTGNPTAPTPTAGDNDNSIATTAFVQGELTAGGFSLASPAFTGNPTAPTPTAGDADTSIATTAFVDTSFAKKASPTFTGTPAAPTATVGTNTTQLATTAFVQAAVAAAAANTFYVWVPVSGAFPARPATTQHLAFLSSTVTPTLDGSLSGGGGMVPNYDIWMRALP